MAPDLRVDDATLASAQASLADGIGILGQALADLATHIGNMTGQRR